MKKLLIKQTDIGIALCDEHWEPLPGQVYVHIDSEPDDIATVTVVFVIGDDVVLAGGATDRFQEQLSEVESSIRRGARVTDARFKL